MRSNLSLKRSKNVLASQSRGDAPEDSGCEFEGFRWRIVLRVFQSVRGLADDSVTRLDKMRIGLWKWGIWPSRIGLGISCGQRETSSDANGPNIAQDDYVVISLKQALFDVKHLKMHWRLGLRPRPHWGLTTLPQNPNREGFCALGARARVPSTPLFVPYVRNVRPGSIILWPGYVLVTMKVWLRHWIH